MSYTTIDKIRQIWTVEQAEELVSELYITDLPVGLDTETVGINPKKESPVYKGRIACWSLAYFDKSLGRHPIRGTALAQSVFIPNWGKYEVLLDTFKPWLESEKPKVGHNIYTFDKHILENHGVKLNGVYCDTMRLAKLVFNNTFIKNDLKTLMYKNFQYSYGDYKDLFWAPGILKYKFVKKDKQTWRKILGERVPTFIAAGDHCRYSVAKNKRRFIPLDEIDTEAYRCRLQTLIEYASLDAKASLELYLVLKKRAEKIV